jgi:hypothetical protein
MARMPVVLGAFAAPAAVAAGDDFHPSDPAIIATTGRLDSGDWLS